MIAVDVPAIVCRGEFAWDCGWALRVVDCESSGDAGALGAGRYVGWWQVDGGSFDPEENTRQAYDQWRQWQAGERLNPWPSCPRWSG